jgi:hypothetical protein
MFKMMRRPGIIYGLDTCWYFLGHRHTGGFFSQLPNEEIHSPSFVTCLLYPSQRKNSWRSMTEPGLRISYDAAARHTTRKIPMAFSFNPLYFNCLYFSGVYFSTAGYFNAHIFQCLMRGGSSQRIIKAHYKSQPLFTACLNHQIWCQYIFGTPERLPAFGVCTFPTVITTSMGQD